MFRLSEVNSTGGEKEVQGVLAKTMVVNAVMMMENTKKSHWGYD